MSLLSPTGITSMENTAVNLLNSGKPGRNQKISLQLLDRFALNGLDFDEITAAQPIIR
jgi:hypothetical protein